jgi:ubiquitin-protein ligase
LLPTTTTGTTIYQPRIDSMQDGLVMNIMIASITTWTATIMVETVVDVLSTWFTAQIEIALPNTGWGISL